MAKTATLAATYKHVMNGIAAGEPVDHDLFIAAVAYAKSSKRRTPKTDNFIEVAKITEEPKSKPSKVCIEDDCNATAYAKSRCSKHYTAHRREDADQRELANKASRDYRARLATAITPIV